MLAEVDTLPIERYLVIRDKKLDVPPRYPHFNSLLIASGWVSVTVDACYADVRLPKVYEWVFELQNPGNHWPKKSIVRQAFAYGQQLDSLVHGYPMHCLIEFSDAPVLPIFQELPANNGGLTMHRGIGLCTAADWPAIYQALY